MAAERQDEGDRARRGPEGAAPAAVNGTGAGSTDADTTAAKRTAPDATVTGGPTGTGGASPRRLDAGGGRHAATEQGGRSRRTGTALGHAAADWAVSRRVPVAGRPVRYREAGTGPTIVLIHGLGISADYWGRTAPSLAARGFRVLAPDLPGFGLTSGPPGGLSVPEQTAAVLDWSQALRLDPAVYVGHSISCHAAIELTATAPDTVRGLVLVAPNRPGGAATMARQMFDLARDSLREPLRLVPLVASTYLRAGPARVWRTWRRGLEYDPIPRLPIITAPALVIAGERDVVAGEYAGDVAEAIPKGRLVSIRGAAHAAFYGEPEAFNAVVADFVRGL